MSKKQLFFAYFVKIQRKVFTYAKYFVIIYDVIICDLSDNFGGEPVNLININKKNLSDFKNGKAKKILDSVKPFFKDLVDNHYFKFTICLSLILNMIIEISARRSLVKGAVYIVTHPLFFLYNSVLIMLTFLVALLCKKRVFSMLLILSLWIAAAVTNSVLILYRNSPFIAADFSVLKSALSIMNVYMTGFQMVMVVLAALIVISGLILLFVKEKRKKTDYKKLGIMLAVSAVVSVLPSGYIKAEKEKNTDSNLTDDAYRYGFVCCFLNSVFNSGVDKPQVYSKESIDGTLKKIGSDSVPVKEPNIIAIQLESFADPYKIHGARYSEDPVPNFRRLKTENASGKLNVSVYGGGTANTEFEVLTGMSLKYFGIGEYPYESFLTSNTAESICYDLKPLGYTSHALHNHTGTFYDRNEVYKNLGFDTFTPSEYMNGLEYNMLGWEKSTVFTDKIIKSLNSTPGRDFVFTVTSQCHGKYPDVFSGGEITVSGSESIRSIKPQLEYYVNQLHEEDKWLGDLITTLEEYPEPIMLVIYGDHMPALNFSEEMLKDKSIYQTEYVIWTNYRSKTEDRELSSYNLMSAALSTVGINNGYFTKLHQYALKNGVDCSAELKSFQYDVIEGEKYLYDGDAERFLPTDLKLGIDEIKITSIKVRRGNVLIKGENFTPSSIVCIDNNQLKTEFFDENTLSIRRSDFKKDYKEIRIAQRAANFTVLGYSEPWQQP